MRLSFLYIAVPLACLAACGDLASEPSLSAAIRRAPPQPRALPGHLSVPVRYRPCEPDSTRRLDCRFTATVAANEKWSALGGRIAAATDSGADPDVLHASALFDLASGAVGSTLDRSISNLEIASRVQPTADRFLDLSAAYLARSGRDGDAQSLIAALDAAERGYALDSTDARLRFNKALALRELGLYGSAKTEFDRAAAFEGDDDWRREAIAYRDAIAIDTVRIPHDSVLDPATMERFARAHSNEARGRSWIFLASWGRATLARDFVTAEHHLKLAEAAGRAIAESHTDPSIADAVKAIRDAVSRDRLAEAHAALIEGQRHAGAGRAADAERAFTTAIRIGAASPALAAWAAQAAANNRNGFQDRDGAERGLRAVLASPAATRYPALIARTWFNLGVLLLRDRRFDEGKRAVANARDLFERLGERELQGTAIGQLAEAVDLDGDRRAAYDLFVAALQRLRDYPLSNWRHNALLLISQGAMQDGYTAAAAVIETEDAVASQAARRVPSVIETQLNRARAARSAKDPAKAEAAITAGRGLLAQTSGVIQGQLKAELDIEAVESGIGPRANDRHLLDSAVAFFAASENFAKQLAAHGARARHLIRAGDTTAAERDLGVAIRIYEERRAAVTDPGQKSLLVQQARIVVDALTVLQVARGDAAAALATRERIRTDRARRSDAPSDLTIELALIGDRLFVLTARGTQVRAQLIQADSIRTEIELLTIALERAAPAAIWEPALAAVSRRILGPLASDLVSRDSVIAIVAGGEMSRVPFAALRDAATGKFLVERHAIRLVPSFADAADRSTPVRSGARAVLVEPAIDRRANPTLGLLQGAAAEIDSISRMFESPSVLQGTGDTARVAESLRAAEVFHFAGHAIMDDARPHQSRLVVGARGLTAQSIAAMRLPKLRLVTLSACETTRSATGAGAGFLGLTQSFLTAGADGVIGSLWKVDDASTQRLMSSFYGALARLNDPVLALQAAQKTMLSESPAAWAAFTYTGK